MATGIAALEEALRGRGMAAAGQLARTPIQAKEHDTVLLPSDLIRDDGSLDVYDDVFNLFRPTYQKNQPSIQCSGLVGYIPLNDAYALEVTTRVPVGNLERLVGMAAGYAPLVLRKYTRLFGHAEDRPEALFDVLADQLLEAFDRILGSGLLKTYDRVVRVGSSPSGRIMPFDTGWLTAKVGRPTAMSSSFHRTPDFGPNRLLRHAFEKLLARYIGIRDQKQRARTLRLRKAVARLGDVRRASQSDLTPQAIAGYIRHLPVHHEHYADALMVAHLIVYDLGLSIRQAGGIAILPSILIDMSTVFESYVRRILAEGLADDPAILVKDGNKDGDGGAKVLLYDPIRAGLNSPDATPDIVIEVNGIPALVIDAKYKPAAKLPDRGDVNQVVVYGARYAAPRIMVLHAGRPGTRVPAEFCGSIGGFQVFNGMIDLAAAAIETEEKAFVAAIRALL